MPFAEHLCEKVPADLRDEDALFLGDILSTGYFCAENGGIRPGDTVAVFGAGPVGLLAMQSAQLFGPARVFAVDRVDDRLELAAELGAEPVSLFKDLTLRMGICNARNYIAPLMTLVQRGKLAPARIVTHTLPLADAPRGYAIFDRKEDRAIKVLLRP